ncbi:MAG: hypothetical protein AMJ53_04360 [Gammaproteobacteria bacterium SG8_11]|nr:MAG: hypothetical protein AMJ53_04360 [Gammaproteobacteria bacterium SG8_11]
MNDTVIFTLEIITCLAISGSVIYVLNPLLNEVLTETCGTQKRALFWVRFTDIMLLISPLLMVIFFTHTGESNAPSSLIIFKDTLFRSLLGEFIGLAIIGQIIWKSLQLPGQSSASGNTKPEAVTGQ